MTKMKIYKNENNCPRQYSYNIKTKMIDEKNLQKLKLK